MQAHASAAVVNFSENCEQELLPPYLDTLISKLLTLLQRGQRTVQVLCRAVPPFHIHIHSNPPIVFVARSCIISLFAARRYLIQVSACKDRVCIGGDWMAVPPVAPTLQGAHDVEVTYDTHTVHHWPL